jgi:hypothetical protein
MMSIWRSTLICSVVQWTMSVKLVNLAQREREREREKERERGGPNLPKRERACLFSGK